MREEALRRYAPLYFNARYFGADKTLRRHLGLDDDAVIPLGLPHGVDFGHVRPCQDLHTVEPIHWAHNRRIAAVAATYKPTIAIPHPFLLAVQAAPHSGGPGRTLVVGPPPSPENDRRLLRLLDISRAGDTTILVKPKTGYTQSIAFWRGHGFLTATLPDFGPPSYEAVAAALCGYDRVVGCTFSSLLVFAAAAGMAVELLLDYHYQCYDLVERGTRFEVVDWSSSVARAVVEVFASGDKPAVTALARDLLGSDLEFRPAVLRDQLAAAIDALDRPFHWMKPHSSLTRYAGGLAARWLRRPGVLRFAPLGTLQRRFSPQIWARDLNEFQAWQNGGTGGSIVEELRPFRRGVTVPGDAIDPYGFPYGL